MQLGMIGLGRMGGNMTRRLLKNGHQLVVHDRNASNVSALTGEGALGADSLESLVQQLQAPRAVWIMVPAGPPTEDTVVALSKLLQAGDTIIDGGNSFYKDDVRRAEMLAPHGIHYLDCGTSGGIWGEQRGYCLMVGGATEAFTRLEPIFATLAPGGSGIPPVPGRETMEGLTKTAELGYLHCGPSGAGHYVKMVHNGIEYGLMQAYAEGFDIMRGASSENLPKGLSYNLNLADIAELWRRGSVVSSWLLDLTANALSTDGKLSGYTGFVEDSGEGRWTIQAALEEGVGAEVLATALFTRFRSRQEHTFAEKMLSAMRKGFGGHIEQPTEQKVKQGL
ncbi:MAG: decarboxylating 6-phosphogluconate dehydrogenase [Verrucomicrobia bacterium]|nr:decarboxylating 6-phosphogluconate dehydrogenase [Verrucomicrobiota bacterium]